jgi:hypothetical protein
MKRGQGPDRPRNPPPRSASQPALFPSSGIPRCRGQIADGCRAYKRRSSRRIPGCSRRYRAHGCKESRRQVSVMPLPSAMAGNTWNERPERPQGSHSNRACPSACRALNSRAFVSDANVATSCDKGGASCQTSCRTKPYSEPVTSTGRAQFARVFPPFITRRPVRRRFDGSRRRFCAMRSGPPRDRTLSEAPLLRWISAGVQRRYRGSQRLPTVLRRDGRRRAEIRSEGCISRTAPILAAACAALEFAVRAGR